MEPLSATAAQKPGDSPASDPRPALVLTGGGARAAYQVGFLRCLARHMPEAGFPIITGVSAGAINAACLAASPGSLAEAVDRLSTLWSDLRPERIYRIGAGSLGGSVVRWIVRLLSGGSAAAPRVRGLLDTSPLRQLLLDTLETRSGTLPGVSENLARGRLSALALTTLNYATGQTVTWTQGCDIAAWERPARLGVKTRISVDHIMASAALPLIFPAVPLAGSWYGDGGIRLSAPLAPAIHLGADRILAVSTRYPRTRREADTPQIRGYPPPAQVAGVLLNAIFLDAIDQDAHRLERINRLLAGLPETRHGSLRPVRLVVLRPSRDLGRLAAAYQMELPRTLRFLMRGLGTGETASPDLLSLLLFEPDYIARLIAIGEADAEARVEEIRALMTG